MLVFLNLIFTDFILSMAVQDVLLVTGKDTQTYYFIEETDMHVYSVTDHYLISIIA